MIIACPECASPFEIPDDRIAAMVQIKCPTCSYRMILDFAAANDPSLVESGMQMASGFRSAADYRAAAAPPAAAPEPEEEVAPLRPVPDRAARLPPGAPANVTAPPIEHIQTDVVEDLGPGTLAPSRAVPQRQAKRPPAQPVEDPRRGDTKVGPLPPPPSASQARAPQAPDFDDDAPTQIHSADSVSQQAADLPPPPRQVARPGATVPASSSETMPAPGSGIPAPIDEAPADPAPEDIQTRPEPEMELPVGRPGFDAPAPRAASTFADPVPDEFGDLDDDFEFRKGSPLGTAVVTLLLIAALGLVAASMALKNTPDPRPLLEDLYRQYVKQ